jgi:hypothetical protein
MSNIINRGHYDVSERKITFERWQDVEPFLERNKKLQALPQHSDWGRHIASIPNIFLEKWLQEEWDRGNFIKLGPEFDEIIAKKLNDPDYRFLRVDK